MESIYEQSMENGNSGQESDLRIDEITRDKQSSIFMTYSTQYQQSQVPTKRVQMLAQNKLTFNIEEEEIEPLEGEESESNHDRCQ